MEVISYNDEAGRFEYQLVKNYSKNPKVYYVTRGKCLSCHQGQAPIFSIPSWADTSLNQNMSKLIASKLGIKESNSKKTLSTDYKKNFMETFIVKIMPSFMILLLENLTQLIFMNVFGMLVVMKVMNAA
jgi:hypothetical protein